MLPRTQVAALILDITGTALPKFQALLAQRAAAVADWLVRSIDACAGQGASGYYSRVFHPLRGWAPPLPETTAALIPSLFHYSAFANRPELAALAATQARWILSLQSLDGSFPGGFGHAGRKADPSPFSTGQAMLALVATFDQTRREEFLQGAAGAARWLCDELNPDAGIWLPHPQAAFQPAHYTTVCWAMLEVCRRAHEPRVHNQALRALKTLASWQLPNRAINNWGLHEDRPAFTDHIADTLRGFWECGGILGDEGGQYRKIAARAAAALREQCQSDGNASGAKSAPGRLAGAYDVDLNADSSFVCLAGNCRMARMWLDCAEAAADIEYFRAALSCLYFVTKKQKMHAAGPATLGALAGSSPRWAACSPLRYPSSSAQSFLDALMHIHEVIEHSRLDD